MKLVEMRAQLDAERAAIAAEVEAAYEVKNFAGIDKLTARADALDAAEDNLTRYTKVAAFAGDAADPHALPSAAIDDGKRLSFANVGAKVAKEIGTKSLAAGLSTIVATELTQSPIAIGKPATGLLDVLPVMSHTSPLYAYLRQSVRTNNAAVVASGAVKPTSVYTMIQVANTLAVIAHLSEGVDRFWLQDNRMLQGFISSELHFGLERAVEAKALADINGTSGIATQAWATSIPVTLRKALTQLETTGYTASAFVLHPADFELIELQLSTTNAVEHIGLPYDPAQRRLYGVPIATTIAQTAGVGHVIADGAVALDVGTPGVEIIWSETSNADDFSKNSIRARCEGRYGTSIFTPLGVVVADLTA